MVASGNRLICGSVLPVLWGEREIRRKTLGSVPDDLQERSQNFEKKKATVTLGMPVHLSVSIEQLGSQWKDFHEILVFGYFFFFENMSRKLNFH